MPIAALSQNISVGETCERFSTEKGRGLHAEKDIPANRRFLHVERVLLVSLDIPRLKDTCYSCLGYRNELCKADRQLIFDEDDELFKLKACAGCHVVRYCSQACQKVSWQTAHRHECAVFASLYPNVLPNHVRGIVQLLLLKKASRLPPGEWDALMKLESHLEKWESKGGEIWENIQLMSLGAKKYSGTALDLSIVRKLVCKLLVNSFTMVNICFDPLGLALQPMIGLINHSCNYNSVIEFNWTDTGCHHISVRALRPIAKGEEIVISYIDATNPGYSRQKELQEKYFFTCQCQRCLHESCIDRIEDAGEALLEKRALELLELARIDTSTSGPVSKLEWAIHLLRKESSWPLHRQPLVSLRQNLVVALLAADQPHLALLHAWIQLHEVDSKLMPVANHPIRLVHHWLLVNLLYHLATDEAKPIVCQSTKPRYDLCQTSINFPTLFYSMLHCLNTAVCGDKDSAFATMVRNSYRDVFRVYSDTEVQEHPNADQVAVEVAKLNLETLALLERELVWGAEADEAEAQIRVQD